MSDARMAPVQRGFPIPWSVAEAAYEVYAHINGSGQSLERLCERGGFGVGELTAYLFARPFPRDQWRGVSEAHFQWQGRLGKINATLPRLPADGAGG